MNFKKLFLFIILMSLPISAMELVKTLDKETKLVGWKFSEGNFQLELIQRSPEQTRSFFQGRGFSATVANDIATSCVLQTIVRNTEADNKTDAVQVSLKDWRVVTADSVDKVDNKEKPIKLKETWNKEWQEGSIKNSARIAFRWATFPTIQTFDPGGDFNWGMISVGPKPGTLFDLHIFWKQGDEEHDAWIKQMACPLDQ